MTIQDEMIQEVQTKNKIKAYEEQEQMRNDCKAFLDDCSVFNLQEIHSEIKRMKRIKGGKE